MNIYITAIYQLPEMMKLINVEEGLTGYIALTIRDYNELSRLSPSLVLKVRDAIEGQEGFITKYQIDKLYEFVHKYDMVHRWVICCDAGMSRSPAVAIALHEYYKQYKMADKCKQYYNMYNCSVYKAIRNRFEELDKENRK